VLSLVAVLLWFRLVKRWQVSKAPIRSKVGIKIVASRIEAPLRQIAENAGVDGAVVAGKVRESEDLLWLQCSNRRIWRSVQSGVIDPAKVVRTLWKMQPLLLGLLITTEAMVADKPEKAGAAGGGMPDMGGMGGMGGMM